MLPGYLSKKKSIRKKILTLVIGVTAFALFTANIIELASEFTASRYKTKAHLEYVTNIVQKEISNYQYKDGGLSHIGDFMKSFQFDPYIDKTCYYGADGSLLTSYISPSSIVEYGQKALCPEKSDNLQIFKNDATHIYEIINIPNNNNDSHGTVLMKYDLERDIEYLINKEIISLITFLLALIFAYLIALRLQNAITKPIMHLSGFAATLSEKPDYSLRAKKFSDDEIGLLAETINNMVANMGEKNDALKSARNDAEHANHMKSDFLAIMSHEIRTPMNGIIGTADLLAETKLTKTQKNYTSVIVKSAQTLLELINDVLDFSKIEAGKLELEKTDFDIVQDIEDIIDMLDVSVRQKGLELKLVNNLQENYHLRGDPVRLKQILINLTSNAIKFTDEGSITITLDEDPQAPQTNNTKQIWVSVADTGIGIPLDRQDHIFDSFSQADQSTTRKFGGSGLGLSICKKLTEMMGGTIAVQSIPGSGSTFWFSVPYEIAPEKIQKLDDGNTLNTIQNDPDDMRVMLVEDNPTNTMITEQILQQEGYQVTCCVNGQDAVENYAKDVYPFILMDCHMPVMDGFEATQKIRKFEEENNLPRAKIYALTASALKGDREKCIAAGMDDYIAKPFRKKDFVKKIRQAS